MNPRDLHINQSVSRFSETFVIAKRATILGIFLVLSAGVITISYQIGLLDGLLNSLTLFPIATISVHVQAPLDEATVRSWLPKLSDKTLIGLRVRPLSDMILGKSWVDMVSIRKVFPDTLEINIATKQALALGVIKGEGFFFDSNGKVIEKSSPQAWAVPVPIVSRSDDSDWEGGQWATVVRKLPEPLRPQVSEIALERFPYFRIFLNSPRWEVALAFENWEAQLPYLTHLMQYAASQFAHVRKINLILSKKAIVSGRFSK
ncbi:MAG: FtsQ-type POTRA domain-containing protein [Deltaproteobacteria bacterium]|nr:FtsQ-type POTRA domain-containing protein [Deltaproteobacteria bacterium]MBI3295186.1 FtsQ-type POTRA domain-containing protein [Deltaproteobacteria bacterium]